MAHVLPLPTEQLSEQRELLDAVRSVYGFVPNSMLTMGRRPAVLEGFSALARAVMADPGETSAELRWLVAHVTSRVAGCRYCQAHTVHNATAAAGASPEKVDAVWQFETSPLFTDAERAALRLAAAAGAVPNEATNEHFAALRPYFGDGGITELVAVIALFGFLNRWNDTLASELEPAALDFAADHLAHTGWSAGKHQTTTEGDHR